MSCYVTFHSSSQAKLLYAYGTKSLACEDAKYTMLCHAMSLPSAYRKMQFIVIRLMQVQDSHSASLSKTSK